MIAPLSNAQESTLLDAAEASGDARPLSDAEAGALLEVIFAPATARELVTCPFCDKSLDGARHPVEVGGRMLHAYCAAVYDLEERLTAHIKALEAQLGDVEYRT